MIKKITYTFLAALTLCGCMGHNGMTSNVVRFNLEATEHRWGREGWFLGLWLTLIYPVSIILDLLIFNSVEFWTGENPINGRSPLVDIPMEQVKKMGFENIDKAQIERISSTEAKLHLEFENGDAITFDVNRTDLNYIVSYRGVEFYTGTIQE
ncbi:DUF3332 family protein [Lentisphaera profundi]|uniref:DUF3332 family protein n=1 Tax=Lentisphaera profundi TaxID=1658616 RepID=A0ABY7VR23_9BACT|nr:DUF3332 family protein [Lentisphaera profundi]WDE96142.1 DUF3332 family protein [Lentisphaera profundi]